MRPVLLVLLLVGVVCSSDILAVLPITSHSHQIVYRTLLLELNRRGHNITVITPNPVNDPTLTNYTEIDVSFFYETWNTKMIANPSDLRLGLSFPELLFVPFTLIAEELCHAYLSHPPVRDLIRRNPRYDLVISEFGVCPCLYGFAKFSEFRHVGVFSFQASPIVHSNIGNPIDASYIPEAFVWTVYGYVMTTHEKIARKYFGDDSPNLIEIERNLSVMMVNSHFTMDDPRPNVPNMIEIGGPAFHLIGSKPKPLDKAEMHGFLLIGLLLCGLIAVHGSNILLILPTASYSHQIFYRVYSLELQKRGHNLTVVTPNPINDTTLTNYREVDVGYTYDHMRQLLDISSESGRVNRMFSEMFFITFAKIINKMCHSQLSDPNVFGIYERNEKFDVVVFESGVSSCFYPFGKLADWKMVGISSFQAGIFTEMLLGGWPNPSFVPDLFLGYSDRMSFLQRLRSTVFFWNTFLFMRWLKSYETNIAKSYFGSNIEPTINMEAKLAVVLDNNHFTMSYPKSKNVNSIPIGGPALHLYGIKTKPLPKDLQEFMDDAPHGVIYFSLGTNVKTGNMPKRDEEQLLETFRRLKQKVVWKWENENVEVKLDNVYKRKWFSQIDVLAHPNVKAFVTQGGLQSTGEAIHFRVPMVMFPFFADQGHNAKKMELAGAAIVLEIDYLNADMFTEALNQIIYNKTYKENIVKLSELVNDQPIPPLDKAVWWTEYVIRHNGASHLKSVATTMPWYQYFLLDVLAFVFAVLFIFFYIFYRICKFLAKFAFPSKSKKD